MTKAYQIVYNKYDNYKIGRRTGKDRIMLDLHKYFGKKVCVATSGGADSTALLHYLKTRENECGYSLSAVHCEHGIRGEESVEDMRFVERLCNEWKDPSKVDRSAAYMARYIAKNLVAAGVAKEILVQLSYAIGIAKPVSIYVNTYGTSSLTISDGEIAQKVGELFDLRPAKIISKFGLNNPIYLPTAQYGHFGRDPFTKKCEVIRNGEKVEKELQFFGWELLDSVELIKEAFSSVQKQG